MPTEEGDMLERWRDALEHSERGESKYKTLVRTVVDEIEQGLLSEFQRLPSQRRVAQALGISGQTVTNAYQELERLGILSCEVGRGTYVAKRLSKHVTTCILDQAEAAATDLSTARMIHTDLHDRFWRQSCADLSQEIQQPWIRACRPIAGFASHRQAASIWLARLGMPVDPDSIMLTNGATHGVFLSLAAVAGHGDLVLCEGLTDHGVIGSSHVLGFTLKGLETDQFGIRPEDFEDICSSERVKALVCTPNLNNPTASLMPESRRQEIARIAKQHGVWIIEDDVHGALMGPDNPAPISSLLPEQAFYCTSLTKSVMTGMRVGYLAVPKKMALRTESILRVSSWMSMPTMAEIASRWILDGRADTLATLQRQLLAARQQMVSECLGDYIIGQHPSAMIAWLRLPEHWQAHALVSKLRERNIAVTPAEPFTVHKGPELNAIRIAVGGEYTDEQMRQSLTSIADLLAQVPLSFQPLAS